MRTDPDANSPLNTHQGRSQDASLIVLVQNEFKLKVEEDAYRYYDAATGLLVRTEKSQEMQGQTITSIQDLSDYREVNGVLFPFVQKITAGPQVIEMATSEIVVNEGVSAEDFK